MLIHVNIDGQAPNKIGCAKLAREVSHFFKYQRFAKEGRTARKTFVALKIWHRCISEISVC